MSILLSMSGGLGLFLFGMKMMSEGIERAAGAKLREILEFFTKNRMIGLLVGVFFTALVQSSSACTVMVVSFVNSGLMSLYQAAGVIFGANIGTTITSQLVSLNLSDAAPVFLLIGALMVLFVKNKGTEKVGEVILGFGVLFMGLNIMADAMAGLKEVEQVSEILGSLKSPLLAILAGTVLTAVIQSSSVTVSIVLLMANEGLLMLPICIYIILGCNIGSCGSALLASLAGKKDAKRAAMIHFLFNVFGSVVIFLLLQFTLDLVVEKILAFSGGDQGRFVANVHTLIKVLQVIFLFPFSNYIVKLTYFLVPGSDDSMDYRENFHLQYIGEKFVFSPATAVVEVTKELERMASLASENLNRAMNGLITLDKEDVDQVYEVERNIDYLNREITNYLVKISQASLPVDDARRIGILFHVANDIERIGDHAENVADAARSRMDTGVTFSKKALKDMGDMLDMVNTLIRFSVDVFARNVWDEEMMSDIVHLEEAIDEKEKELQVLHVERLTKNECTPEAGMLFTDIISGMERVADHATNIAFSVETDES